MTHKITISDKLSLPLEAVTQTFAILGKRGSGKTNTSVVITEGMLSAGAHVVILDPLDVWHGLRSSADGNSPGFPITVLGGNHADLPLEASAGAVIADFVVNRQAPIILSLRHFSNNEQRRFVTDFCERLFHRKGEAGRQQPLHLVIDEADEFAPQRIMAGQERMFGAIDRIVRRGRACGLGVTLISQRAAVINKDVLTQTEVLICHQTVSPQDRKALESWIEAHDAHDQRGAFMESLAALAIGEAWFWSPGWMDAFTRVKVRARSTFDSSQTPKAGAVVITPKKLAAVDLDTLSRDMAATIERAKADDPKELRLEIKRRDLRISELERAKAPAADPAALATAEKRGYDRGVMQGKQACDAYAERASKAQEFLAQASKTLGDGAIASVREMSTARLAPPVSTPAPTRRAPAVTSNGHLAGPEQRILDAIAWLESIGVDTPEQTAVAFLAGYTYGGGAFNNPRGALRTRGLVEYAGDGIRLTNAGRELANFPDQALSAEELQRRVLERLPGPEQKILQVIIAAYPKSVENDECARRAGYTPDGGAYNNPRGRLRTLGLIEYPERGHVRARPLLFLEVSR